MNIKRVNVSSSVIACADAIVELKVPAYHILFQTYVNVTSSGITCEDVTVMLKVPYYHILFQT